MYLQSLSLYCFTQNALNDGPKLYIQRSNPSVLADREAAVTLEIERWIPLVFLRTHRRNSLPSIH